MFDSIKNYYPSKTAMIGGAICAAAAIEMAILVPSNISQIKSAAEAALEPLKYELSANLGGAIFYGLCAFNVIPRTAVIGASIFLLYSVINFHDAGAYLTSRVIGHTMKFITDEIVMPVMEHIIAPLVARIVHIASQLIGLIGNILVKMPLPEHPVWLGVLVLCGAIAIHQWVIPYFMRPVSTLKVPTT